MRGSEEILISRPGVPGLHGAPGSVTAPRSQHGCILWPKTSTEVDTPTQDTGTVRVNLFVPPATDLLPTDSVVARGRTWTVEGDAEEYVMHGRMRGRIFTLSRPVT